MKYGDIKENKEVLAFIKKGNDNLGYGENFTQILQKDVLTFYFDSLF